MDARHRLAANVRRYRKALGLSQEAFAYHADIDRTYVSGVERAHRNASVDIIGKFADALGVDVALLFEHPPEG